VRIRTKDRGDAAACVRLVTEIHCTDGYPQPLPADPAAFVTPSTVINRLHDRAPRQSHRT